MPNTPPCSRFLGVIVLAAVVAAGTGFAPPARAQEASHAVPLAVHDGGAASAEASALYCDYVRAVAQSRSALMKSPALVARFGTMQSVAEEDVAISGYQERELLYRMRVGVTFSPTLFHRGSLLQRRAEAECRRQAATVALQARGGAPEESMRRALAAQIKVLELAIPEAEARVSELRARVDAGTARLSELRAMQGGADELRAGLARLRLQRVELGPPAPEHDKAVDPHQETELRSAEADLARQDARLRKSGAFDLVIEGGAERIFGVGQPTPLYGAVSLQISPGWLWQIGAERRAHGASAALIQRQGSDVAAVLREAERAERLVRELAARRLSEIQRALAEVQAHTATLIALDTSEARAEAAAFWLEEVQLLSERAYWEQRAAPRSRPEPEASRAREGD
jgi:hypothetical protein